MIRVAAVLALFAAFADGGKVQWRPTKEHDAALTEAKNHGIPVFLYFADKDAACKALDAGALSDPDVVKASERLVRVIIRATDAKLYATYADKYKVTSAPRFLFLDPDGDVIRSSTPENNAAIVTSMIVEVAESATRGPRWMEDADAALEVGRNDSRLVLLAFSDGKKDATAFLKTFGDPVFKGIWTKFAAAKVPFEKEGEACTRWKVKLPSTLVLVDARGADPKIVKSITGPKSPKELKKDLDAILKTFEGAK